MKKIHIRMIVQDKYEDSFHFAARMELYCNEILKEADHNSVVLFPTSASDGRHTVIIQFTTVG